ncbi:BREX-1 system adenine-specific DNA-methyltransferase PglX [Bacillus haynesii]|uniref:BREX-1 system adenine-specific DNA-methyltransferase PglX n=1 Tax=Bacillus haynesii TaxID=1925021 RepID=UPI00227F3C24|nr:BREX-1 system adenine-specific DNA-methyltransferase PglX [Bacillus haynesii]MCY9373378.1 BREX-1 system adenine-specific DNA-methyltransferase PglX [Bacillus haynesii]MEC0721634.1 BREX-1 system adenine-specific DNA-methyltransferase PglX [Bacillus haynesii]
MNKSALKSFATNARRELLKKVEAKAMKIGITEDNIKKADIESSDAIFIDGRQLSKEEKVQRDRLIDRIIQIGFKQVMEEVAYTWFNRFTALRFMEVNDYLPTKVRVLSSTNTGSTEPDMMKEALFLDLDLDKEYIYELKMNNNSEELFKYLIIKHCNDLNRYMPFMFETIDDYTEILFPEGLLSTDSFIRQMTNIEFILESDWEEIEIIGWLYQYYNTEMNEIVYDGSMSKSRVPKDLLPAATQLFTPDWAVKYMVENSLGSLWLERHPDNNLMGTWKYYLERPEATPKEKKQRLSPEDIKVFDPCMGSGHILVYAFEVLMQIYESCGYVKRDAARLILEKNLYGIDIDYRAYQLACFAVVMKARKYNRRILTEGIRLNLCSIEESNQIAKLDLTYFKNHLKHEDTETFNYLINVFQNAKEYGSILNVEVKDYDSLLNSLSEITKNGIAEDLFQSHILNEISKQMPKLLKQARIMTQQYDIVITNPPYLNSSRMSPLLNDYVKKHFPYTKTDLSMVMYQKAIDSYSVKGGFISYITTTSWMFLKSFEQLRKRLLATVEFSSLVDFGTELFDGKVGHNPIVSWVNKNSTPKSKMVAIRLTDYNYSKKDKKESEYFELKNRYYPNQVNFSKISGSPFAYWSTPDLISIFSEVDELSHFGIARRGLQTGNSSRFVRGWFEVSKTKLFLDNLSYNQQLSKDYKWFLFNSGGNYRKWYGNIVDVVDWENDGKNIKSTGKAIIPSEDKYFKACISWNKISSGKFSVRYQRQGIVQGDASPFFYTEDESTLKYILALLNASVVREIMKILSPTLNFEVGNISKIPVVFKEEIRSEIEHLVDSNIKISKVEWDSFELSWDFDKHPLMKFKSKTIKSSFKKWECFTEKQFNKIKDNEEKINHIFIELYGLQGMLSHKLENKDIAIRKSDLERDIKSFISYAIGCSFGRYSLDEDGLIYAGGKFDSVQYQTFLADKDNILPILREAYFEDDIVSRFIDFVQVTFGEETLSENLDFIADVLGRKKGETAKETLRRYFLNDFYKDHLKTYSKRPIYWLFTSGKEKAFNCLIYMHRYDKTTLSRIRTDYLHEYQIRLEAEKKDLLNIIDGDSTAKEISNAKKELKSLDKKIEELKAYDELLHHMADMQIEIDLDDGVKVNYEKFKGLVAKI